VLTRELYRWASAEAVRYLEQAGIVITQTEQKCIEVAEYGLGMLDQVGLELLVYVNTDRCCAKELVLFPGQTCPEHRHPQIGDDIGKEETFRCRLGEVYLYVPGEASRQIKARIPAGKEHVFTVRREVVLLPGEQFTLPPGSLHWFQAGPAGAVVSEFSTKSRDEFDVYTDPDIQAAAPRRV